MVNLSAENWIVLPPGDLAIHRSPTNGDLNTPAYRVATARELLTANHGRPFPWGDLSWPNPKKTDRLWQQHRIGYGGLVHTDWFVTTEGRFGGAPNVPDTLPGSLRACLLLDGGKTDQLADNEGYAFVRLTNQATRHMYRLVQLWAVEHVKADEGSIIVSPLEESGKIRVGFCGRCRICPNLELVSFRALQTALPKYNFELWDEFKDWQV